MLRRINTIRGRLKYQAGDTHFLWCDNAIPFEQINAFYAESTLHFINGIIEGNVFKATIEFKDTSRIEMAVSENDTHDVGVYRDFEQALTAFRKTHLFRQLQDGEMSIPLRTGGHLVVQKHPDGYDDLSFQLNIPSCKQSSINRVLLDAQKGRLRLIGKDGKVNMLLSMDGISDFPLVLHLFSESKIIEETLPNKVAERLKRILISTTVVLALNGWVGIFIYPEWLHTLSVLSGILVFIWLMGFMVLSPLTARFNQWLLRKQQEQEK